MLDFNENINENSQHSHTNKPKSVVYWTQLLSLKPRVMKFYWQTQKHTGINI